MLNAFVDFSFKRIDFKEIPTKTTDDHCPEENTEDIGVVIATDIGEKVRGTLGCYIAAAEWVFNSRKCEYELKGFKTRKVDGKTIKENTFYYLENGKFTEAE